MTFMYMSKTGMIVAVCLMSAGILASIIVLTRGVVLNLIERNRAKRGKV